MAIDYKTFNTKGKHEDLNIIFRHVASGQQVQFLPFITDFKDEYQQIWSPVEVFGRMDAIKNFKRTVRTITLAFDVPSETAAQAEENLKVCSEFLKMNYPVYQNTVMSKPLPATDKSVDSETASDGKNQTKQLEKKSADATDILEPQKGLKPASVMTAPPILQVKFSNLINDGMGDFLYGTIQGMTYAPDAEMGFWTLTTKNGKREQGLVPKVVSFNIVFEVLHTKELGYSYSQKDSSGNLKFRNPTFPYKK